MKITERRIENENSGRIGRSAKHATRTPKVLVVSCSNARLSTGPAEKLTQKISTKSENAPSKPASVVCARIPVAVEAAPVPPTVTVDDIDADDGEYLEFCTDYVKNIYDHLFNVETESPVDPDYLKRHPSLRPQMRMILIQWLVSLQNRYKLLQDTLLLSISILDRFLSITDVAVPVSQFQLLGATCLWVACKYEEIYLPSVNDFVFMCDGAYTAKELQKMEVRLLTTLDFNFSKPLSGHFLRRFSKAGGGYVRTHTVAKYLIELSLYCYELVHCKPSLIAAAALLVAGRVTTEIEWNHTLQFYTRYSVDDLKPDALRIIEIARKAHTNKYLRTTMKKFSSAKFHSVADLFTLNDLLDGLFPN